MPPPDKASSRSAERIAQTLRTELGASPVQRRLPGVRALTRRFSASPLTVQRALAQLTREGLLVTVPGRGTFTAPPRLERPRPDLGWQALALGAQLEGAGPLAELLAPCPPDAICLTSGYPDPSLQPLELLARAMARAARRPSSWGRQPVEGHPGLRAWFAREVGDAIGAEDFLVAPGGQAAIVTVFRALTRPGESILMESPTYPGAVAAARSCGLRVVPVPMDREGVLPEQLAAAFAASRARVFYCQPAFANPTGATLAPARHRAVLDAAAEASAFIVEDDYARDLALERAAPPPLASADPGRVVYIRSLAKSAAPSLRLAGIGSRGPVAARLRAMALVDSLFLSGPLQEAALELVTSPGWHRHRRMVATELRLRRDAAIAAIAGHFAHASLSAVPRGGYTLWLALPEGLDDLELARKAQELGVQVSPGRHWFPAEPTGPFLRLSYFATATEKLDQGIARLGEAAEKLRPSISRRRGRSARVQS